MSRNDDSDSETERALQALFAKARQLWTQDEVLQAEQTYLEALTFATSKFGSTSRHVATAHFFLGAFYAAHNKPHSAEEHYAEMKTILRW